VWQVWPVGFSHCHLSQQSSKAVHCPTTVGGPTITIEQDAGSGQPDQQQQVCRMERRIRTAPRIIQQQKLSRESGAISEEKAEIVR
jgi:hypothetical protein